MFIEMTAFQNILPGENWYNSNSTL